ncbi:MAG: dodecin domain-containing protein [Bacteroidota bacterium]
MLAKHSAEHQDVIRIIGSSPNSFDEAVKNGIATIKEGHEGTPRAKLDFITFEVVQLQGTIKDSTEVALYQAVLDVVGVHHHHDHDHK